MRVIVLGLAATGVIACASAPHGVRVFAPRCAGAEDLEPSLSTQVRYLDQSLRVVGFDHVALNMPSASDLVQQVERASPGWYLLLYTGHGLREDNGDSQVCLGPDSPMSTPTCASHAAVAGALPVDDCVLRKLPKVLGAATIVLDACLSAQVDPRQAPIWTSVISSSPYGIGSDSLFGDRIALALRVAARDPNCDGLVTDQELFDALLHGLYSDISTAEDRAYPKLRRNAPSHIPLPIAPERRSACQAIQGEIRALLQKHGDRWGAFGAALRAQLALRPDARGAQDLPCLDCSQDGSSGWDHFVLSASSADPAALRAAAIDAGLRELPDVDVATAAKVARFAIFTEIFSLGIHCGWVRVERLRDAKLVATLPVAELARAMPRRRSLSARSVVPAAAHRDAAQCQFRYLGVAPKSTATSPMVHCAEHEGQCFLEPCPTARGTP